MDDYLRDMNAMEIIFLDAFQNDDHLRDDAHIAEKALNFLPPPLYLDLVISKSLPSWGQRCYCTT